MKKIDLVYIQDMLEAIEHIQSFVVDVNYDEFSQNNEKQFAVFHALEVLGEAANKLSKNLRDKYSHLPVREAVEMRNILIHGYDVIQLDIVWHTIQKHLPFLHQKLIEVEKELAQ